MDQKHINTDLFATLTIHEMMLKQFAVMLFEGQEDKGDLFIA